MLARGDLSGLAEELTALAAGHAGEGDKLRQLPPALADAFLANDVYRLLLPADLGGAGADPLDYLDMVERVSRADGAVGWNLTIGTGSGLYLGYIPPETARAIAAGPDCCVAGALAPMGRGEKVDGGWRVNGRWGWASGCAQASWMVMGFMEPTDAGPRLRHALTPRDSITVLDTWHVGGLRGTGSTDYEAHDLFVPDAMSFRMFNDPPRHPAAIFHMPGTFFGSAVAIVPVGVAGGCLDGLKALAARKRVRVQGGRSGLAEQAFAQYAVARAEGLIESARAYLRQSIADIWRVVQDGGPVTIEARARGRRACVMAAEASVEAVDLCCRAAGGHALFEAEPFERALRDVRAALGHISLQRVAMEDVGRVLFGLPPVSPIF